MVLTSKDFFPRGVKEALDSFRLIALWGLAPPPIPQHRCQVSGTFGNGTSLYVGVRWRKEGEGEEREEERRERGREEREKGKRERI